jgi:hypothetical protein
MNRDEIIGGLGVDEYCDLVRRSLNEDIKKMFDMNTKQNDIGIVFKNRQFFNSFYIRNMVKPIEVDELMEMLSTPTNKLKAKYMGIDIVVWEKYPLSEEDSEYLIGLKNSYWEVRDESIPCE